MRQEKKKKKKLTFICRLLRMFTIVNVIHQTFILFFISLTISQRMIDNFKEFVIITSSIYMYKLVIHTWDEKLNKKCYINISTFKG